MNTGSFAICIHILTLLAYDQENWMSSADIAESININPVLVRKELSKLKQGGLVKVREGKGGGSQLAKSPEDIHLSEIFRVTSHDHVFSFAKNEPNHDCPVGKSINNWLDKLYSDIDQHIDNLLDNKSLKDFLQQFS